MYRAFYKPANGSNHEVYVEATELDQLPYGALLIVKINDDNTREIAYQKESLTAKEQVFHDFALRFLEFKHDGGLNEEMINYMREHRS